MATIYKCDKCNKIIKKGESTLEHSSLYCKLLRNYNVPENFILCERCAIPLVKYLKELLTLKKTNK